MVHEISVLVHLIAMSLDLTLSVRITSMNTSSKVCHQLPQGVGHFTTPPFSSKWLSFGIEQGESIDRDIKFVELKKKRVFEFTDDFLQKFRQCTEQ